MSLEQVAQERNASPEQISDAQAIAQEINHAWAFPEENLELSRVGQIGYMAAVGSPHQWWEKHCESYRVASAKYKRDRDLNTVCLLVDELIKEANA